MTAQYLIILLIHLKRCNMEKAFVFTLLCPLYTSQVKDDMKRPVYCALIRLLQGKDLSVRVCYILELLVFSVSQHIYSSLSCFKLTM